MRNRIAALLGPALTLVIVNAALAADMPVKAPRAPAAVVAANWTGFYVGLHAGYSWSDPSGFYDQNDANGPADLSHLRLNGPVFGGQVGLNWQVHNNLVIGVEADASWADADDTVFTPEPASRGPDPVTAEREYLASVRGRVGFTLDRTLFYGTGGIGWTRHKLRIFDVFSGTTGTASVSKSGAVYGGGIEHLFESNWTLRIEYLRYDLSTTLALDPAIFSDADLGDSITFGDIDVVRVGVNRRF